MPVIFVVCFLYVCADNFSNNLKEYFMNATIGIYDNHELAVEAVLHLKDSGYPVGQLSIMGLTETEVVDAENHVITKSPIAAASMGVGTGVAVGTAVGILTGVGIFAIPGLGMLYGAGALVGAIAGFDFGLIGGGLASILATVGVKDENAKRYNDVLRRGKYIVVADGTEEEVYKAKDMLHIYGKHTELDLHPAL